MQEKLEGYVREALNELGISGVEFIVEHPAEMAHGDFATNAALVGAKKLGKNPRAHAEEVVAKLKAKNDPDIAAISVAGPGFINFTLSDAYFSKALGQIIEVAKAGKDYARHERYKANTILFEYTDPNPFKVFHVGHFLPATIGESLARLSEFSGATVYRMTYGGDVGPHVAKTLYGLSEFRKKDPALAITPETLGKSYVEGVRSYEEDAAAKKSIDEENKRLYEKSVREKNGDYAEGKRVSVEHFHQMYQTLGIAFDAEVFESEVADAGIAKVRSALGKVFTESNGAIVYKGDETKGLHTRVFITKEGTPTYEAKEVGLTELKFARYPDLTYSLVVTGNEQNDYFRVVFAAIEELHPEYKGKLYQTGHGMLRFASGKMSSRLGNVISGAQFLDELTREIAVKHPDGKSDTRAIAVAAVKFAILRQAVGKDIIFDAEQSISIDGDSGPYLQYTHARLSSLLEKAMHEQKLPAVSGTRFPLAQLERLLTRFPDIVLYAQREAAPQHVANYLLEVAREFNALYGTTQLIDTTPECAYKLALAAATKQVLKEGLWLLGITAPAKM